MKMKEFKNKVVVITGAGSGMGRFYATEFARLGAKVAISDIDPKGLDETKVLLENIKAKGIYSEIVNVGNKDVVFTFAEHVKSELGPAHIIINNAGIGGGGVPVWAMDTDFYAKTMQVNFFSVVYGTQAFLPQLLANQEGAIVNVSSVFGLVGTPNSSDYCASKFAVRGFTESLMVELEGSPITVHLVHPGGIKTNIAKSVDGGEEFTEKYLKTAPIDIVQYVIESIRKGKQRVVFGHNSGFMHLISFGLPLKMRNKLLRREMSDMLDPTYYSDI